MDLRRVPRYDRYMDVGHGNHPSRSTGDTHLSYIHARHHFTQPQEQEVWPLACCTRILIPVSSSLYPNLVGEHLLLADEEVFSKKIDVATE